jgi:hypothetical protein
MLMFLSTYLVKPKQGEKKNLLQRQKKNGKIRRDKEAIR